MNTRLQSTAVVTDSVVLSRGQSEPSEMKLDSSSERAAADEHDTQGVFVNEKNFLFVFPLALFVVLVIFGVALFIG